MKHCSSWVSGSTARPKGRGTRRGGRIAYAFGVVTAAIALTGVVSAQAQPPAALPPEQLNWMGDTTGPPLSGVWTLAERLTTGASVEGWRPWPPPLKGAFADTWKKRLAAAATGQRDFDPVVGCVPPGMPRFITGTRGPLLIVQTKDRVTMYRDGEASRRIWLDGRRLPNPRDLESFLKGTAVGHYDGSDLLVDSRGFKDQPIDSTGAPHSEQLAIKERYHRMPDGTLRVTVTLDDPLAYTAPMTSTVTYRPIDDKGWEPREFICTPKTDYHPDRYVH